MKSCKSEECSTEVITDCLFLTPYILLIDLDIFLDPYLESRRTGSLSVVARSQQQESEPPEEGSYHTAAEPYPRALRPCLAEVEPRTWYFSKVLQMVFSTLFRENLDLKKNYFCFTSTWLNSIRKSTRIFHLKLTTPQMQSCFFQKS